MHEVNFILGHPVVIGIAITFGTVIYDYRKNADTADSWNGGGLWMRA